MSICRLCRGVRRTARDIVGGIGFMIILGLVAWEISKEERENRRE